MKTVYVGMSADLVHPGHLNILRRADQRILEAEGDLMRIKDILELVPGTK